MIKLLFQQFSKAVIIKAHDIVTAAYELTPQGAKKVSFTACHLSKLLLVCTISRVFN